MAEKGEVEERGNMLNRQAKRRSLKAKVLLHLLKGSGRGEAEGIQSVSREGVEKNRQKAERGREGQSRL